MIDERRTSHGEILEKLERILETQEHILSAFPDGVENHRRAHEAQMEAAEAEKKFWEAIKLEVAKKGAISLMIFVWGLLLVGMASSVKSYFHW